MNQNQPTTTLSWNQFWFAPSSTATTSALRILFGGSLTLYILGFTADLTSWTGEGGMIPLQTLQRFSVGEENIYRFSLFYLSENPMVIQLIHWMFLLAALAFTAGIFSRVTNFLAILAILSYVHRLPMLTGLAEPVLIMGLFYLCLSPTGACFSFDAWWRKRRQPKGVGALLVGKRTISRSSFSQVTIRLIQLHTLFFYLLMFATQLSGESWWIGESVWALGAATETSWLDFSGLGKSALLINLWSHEIILFELGFVALIWLRPLRAYLVAAAVVHWLLLMPLLGEYQFCLTMIIASASFIPPEYFEILRGKMVAEEPQIAQKESIKATNQAKPKRAQPIA